MTVRLDRLALFAHLWAVATFSSGLRWINEDNAWGWPMIVGAAFVFRYPRSLRALVAVMLVHVGFVAHIHPFTPNHVLFESLIDIAFLAVLARVLWVRRGALDRDEIFEVFAPAARVALLVLYFYAVLHKLNHDFFDPQVSCGAALLSMVADRLPVPDGVWARVTAIWGTLIVETAIPVLLVLRRTRLLGVALGLVFHFLLAQIPGTGLYSFSTMIFALLTLFLPQGFAERLAARLSDIRLRIRPLRWTILGMLPALVVVAVLAHARGRLLLFGLIVWNVWLLTLAVVCRPVLLGRKETDSGVVKPFRMRTALWALPLVLLLNGLSPYLGLKTLTSFSMVSNLRTEGRHPNHLFMRRWIDLTGLQDDLVRIVETTLPELRRFEENDLLLTYFEFRRICSRTEGDFSVEYVRNGKPRSLVRRDGVSNDPETVRPHPWYRARLLGFRPVDAGPRMSCRR